MNDQPRHHAASLLWYDRPARELITEALPLGNGQLGALIMGDPARDRWALNEATLWTGGPYEPNNPEARSALPEVQRLILSGEYPAAALLAEAKLLGVPRYQSAYQPLADLWLECPGHERYLDYRRQLDLERALVKVSYSVESVHFEREVFISAAGQVLVARLRASVPGAIECMFRLLSEQRPLASWAERIEPWHDPGGFGIRGRNRAAPSVDSALRFEFAAALRTTGGRILPGEAMISVRDASEVLLVAAAATSYVAFDRVDGDPGAIVAERLARARDCDFEQLLEQHLSEYQPLFRRLTIDLGAASAVSTRPTDVRLAEFDSGADPALAALYLQYARYLLIACSRATSQPANLQGLWSEKLSPPWGSKCTININTEMNYWPALPGALAECSEPLLLLLEDLLVTGRKTAETQYGARGWVAHHNVDLWRATAPVDGAECGLWPMGGAWLALHLWDHYEFTLSRAHLERAYPILKGACEFFLDTLLEDPNTSCLVTCPSISPENQHVHGTALCAGPAMDGAILRDLFRATKAASEVLGCDGGLRALLDAAAARLPPYRIGRAGQLQEWQADWDLDVPEPQHRHVSHLFGLHPSRQISPDRTPELAAAARKTLELRGDEATGWSLAWKVNFWARLRDSERAYELLRLLISPKHSYTNLFDAHPPFQIDGNFGGAAGILEMLVQSEQTQLHLLPALPIAWAEGSVTGVKARGGLTVDLRWRDHALVEATITSTTPRTLSVRVGTGRSIDVNLAPGVGCVLSGGSL